MGKVGDSRVDNGIFRKVAGANSGIVYAKGKIPNGIFFVFGRGVVEWNRKENQILNFKFNLLLPFFKKRGVCRGFTRKIARFGFKMGGLTSLV